MKREREPAEVNFTSTYSIFPLISITTATFEISPTAFDLSSNARAYPLTHRLIKANDYTVMIQLVNIAVSSNVIT